MFRFRRILTLWFLPCMGIAICSALPGCGKPNAPTPPPGGATKTQAGTPSDKAKKAAQSEDLIRSIVSRMKLEALGITAQEDDLVGLINQWQNFSQGTQVVEDEVALDESSLEAWRTRLTERQLKQVRRTVFDRSDIERLRTDLLMNAVVKQVAKGSKSDLERVHRVFTNLTRNCELVSAHPDDVPFSPYQSYLLGKVTAADRAWLFAEMLRQLKINSVILSAPLPKDAENWDVNQPFLVGVLLDKQVYLFDPRLGLPLTVPGSKDAPQNIATLEQARASADILKQYNLAEDKPYGITEELLKAPGVFVIGDTGLWSYRFGRLQKAFTGASSMVIAEPLVDLEGAEGQVSRIAKVSGQPWQAAQIAVWDYPELQLAGQESLSAQHQQTLTRLTDAWKTPVIAEPFQQGDKVFARPKATNLLLFARLDHAQGKLEDAVKGYTTVRVQLRQPVDLPGTERLEYAYYMAAEDALFWMGVCKFDQGSTADLKLATERFQQYLQVYQKGRWLDHVHGLLAQIAAQTGDTAAAVAELQKIAPDHPQQAGYQFLKRTWEQAAAKASDK